LIDEEGTVLGWGHSGATSYQPQQNATSASQQAISDALGDTVLRELWVRHTWIGDHVREWLEHKGIILRCFAPATEWDVTFTLADRTWGVAVLAGTGSWVNGRKPDGAYMRVGGMGPFLGDEGSGWDIGFRGIKAALRSTWCDKTRTTLAQAVPQALGVDDLRQAVVGDPITSGQVTRAQIASVAPVVLQEAAAGDAIAASIVDEAAASLADMCALLLDQLDIVGQGYPLIGMAGVIQNSPFYWRILSGKILHHDPSLVPEVPPFKMAVGAALHAMLAADMQITPQIRDRIRQTQAAFLFAQVATLASSQTP